MEITEVRIKLMEESEDRLRAFCSITIDHCFVVRDLKIIEGTHGPFVAMPSRKMSARCGRCGNKNHLRSQYCNQCGSRLRGVQDLRDVEGGNPNKLYADIAHPINQVCRDLIQSSVIGEYLLELERAKVPGYRSRYDEEYAEGSNQTTGSNNESSHSPDSKGLEGDRSVTDGSSTIGSESGSPNTGVNSANTSSNQPSKLPTNSPADRSGEKSGVARRPHMLDLPNKAESRKSTKEREDFGEGIF